MPDTEGIVVGSLFAAALIPTWVFAIPKWWRGDYQHYGRTIFSPVGFVSTAAQEAWYRAPLVVVSALSIAVAGFLLGLMNPAVDGRPPTLLYVAAVLVLAGLLMFVLGVTSVLLFNRPKFLVPPHVRHESGLVSLWKEALLRRRGGDRR